MSMDGAYDVPVLRVSYDYGREYFRCPRTRRHRREPVSEHWIWAGDHRPAVPRALVEHMTNNWATVTPSFEVHPAATYCATRRARIAEEFSGRTIVVATGNFKVRANDTDYRFRAGTDFFYLTGLR